MNTQEIIDRLAALGITTTNCYPKSTFVDKPTSEIVVGLFKREMLEDFYFYNAYSKKIYLFKKPASIENYPKDDFRGSVKFLVPLHECEVVWEDKEYVELPNKQFNEMTLRDYACIHLGVPDTGIEWLDMIISKKGKV